MKNRGDWGWNTETCTHSSNLLIPSTVAAFGSHDGRGLSLNRVTEERLEESFGLTESDAAGPSSRNSRRPKGPNRAAVAKYRKS